MTLSAMIRGAFRWRPLKTAAAAVGLLAATNCAVLPTGPIGTQFKRLIFTWTMAGPINPSLVYIVALNPSTDANPIVQGPIPVVAPPWGNGFVAGNCQYFIEWSQVTAPTYYMLYQFTDSTLNAFFQVGVPRNYVDVTPGGTSFQFEVDVDQLAPTTAQAQALQSVQVNFLTMDHVPQGSSGGSKVWDALGDGRIPSQINSYILVDLRSTGLYNNARYGGLEPQGDCPDPALDIVDFSVQVLAP